MANSIAVMPGIETSLMSRSRGITQAMSRVLSPSTNSHAVYSLEPDIESRMQFDNATNLDRKSGGSPPLLLP